MLRGFLQRAWARLTEDYMGIGRRALSKVGVAVCLAALVSACSHSGAGGAIPSGASGSLQSIGSAGFSALAKAREITSQSCTFTAPGNFNGDILKPGTTAWFNSAMTVSGNGFNEVNIYVTSSKITFTLKDGSVTTVPLPDSNVTISPSAVSGSVLFHDDVAAWHEIVPTGFPGYFFADGGTYPVADRIPSAKDATWSAVISTDTPGISLTWRWAAASYTTLGNSYNGMGVKPMDDATATVYQNDDFAGTPENFKNALAHGGGNGTQNGPDDRWTGKFAKPVTLAPCALSQVTPTPSPNGSPRPTPTPMIQPAHAAYVPNFNDQSVSIINGGTHSVLSTVSVGNGPYGVAVNPSGSLVYIGNRNDGTVSVIDTSTGQVTATIALSPVTDNTGTSQPQFPWGIAFNPSGTRAYVATNDGNSGGATAVIDTSSNTEIAEIQTPSYNSGLPEQPVVSADGSRLFVGYLGSSSVNVYDTSTNNFIGSIFLSGGDPNGIAVSPDGQTVYACDGGGLSYANVATLTETSFQFFNGKGCADVVLNATGTTAYVTNPVGNTVTIINTATHAVLATPAVGLQPEGISITPSGAEVYAANANGNSVSVISTSSNAVTNTISVGATPYAFGNFLK
jgi:YVTN family beta-propeller protein